LFKDRLDAGARLAEELISFCEEDCIVIGIPRGGAIIAKQVADKLNKPWDIIVPRKIGCPFNKEVAIGAVTQDGCCISNDDIVRHYNISDDYINAEVKIQTGEIKRRLIEYKGSDGLPNTLNRTAILVDDGMATGFTAGAAINTMRKHGAAKIIIAVPVASIEAIDILKKSVEEIICLEIPNPFFSVGCSYAEFQQNTDEEIVSLFRQHSVRRYV